MKFYGKVGYGNPSESTEGVWADIITERYYYGDVVKDTRRIVAGSDVNPDISTGNSIEIVADPYAIEHFHAITYVEWAGARWTVTETELKRPRLILRLGGVYNGPGPATNSDEGTTSGTPGTSGRDSGR
jgi:hypothetical protein